MKWNADVADLVDVADPKTMILYSREKVKH